MQKISQEIAVIIISIVILLIIISVVVLLLTVYYDNTKKRLLKEKRVLKTMYEQALLQTKNEIQEQTLTNVSREIHDNITQVLSFVKLNLAMTGSLSETEKAQKVDESRKLVAQAISDLRDLSKSMSFEHIVKLGLAATIQIEADRINKSGVVNADFEVEGDTYPLGDQRELVLFRIFQEALNNTLKHSGAKLLKINLRYSEQIFILTIADDGAGFLNNGLQNDGSGLKNMQSRATLIGAVLTINSEPGKGCCIKITIDRLLQQIYANANYPNSAR